MAKKYKDKEVDKKPKDDIEDRAIDMVLKFKEESTTFYAEKFKRFNYYDRLYIRGAAKTNVPYGRANLELPLAFQQIEPFVSQMTETMVGEAPYIAYEGRNIDDDPAAEEITNFTQYELDCGGFLASWISWIRNVGKYGTGVMKVIWDTDIISIDEEVEKPILMLDPMTGQPIQVGSETVIETQDITRHDGPCFYNLSLFDFFIPRSAVSPDIQKMRGVVHRVYKDLDELLDNPNYSRAHAKIKELIKERDYTEAESSYSQKTPNQYKTTELNQKNQNGLKKFEGKVELLEYWGDFSFKKGESKKPALIVIGCLDGEEIALRVDENPFKFKFKPFIMSNDYTIEGEAYGYGEIDHIKGLIEESTALRNARLDVANLSLNRSWLVERQAGVNLRELYTAPNKIILTNDLNGIKPLDMGGVTPSSVNELARIDFDIQNTTEIINPRQDVSNVGAAFGSTATGVNFLAGKSNLRLLTKARLLEETFFKPLALMLNWYNRDFVTDEMEYRVSGKDGNPYSTLSPDAFLTTVDFKPTSNPDKLNLAQRKDNMNYLLQVVAQIEKVAPGTNNLNELLKDVYKLTGFPHPDKYVKPPQTTILQTPDGQILDTKGQPVNVVPVDEQGQPIQQTQPPQL